jgi:hypothetical protein
MNSNARAPIIGTLRVAMLALAVAMLLQGGQAWAGVQYLDDGATQNLNGGWDLPAQGTCPVDLTQPTRPDCVALRLNVVQASCVAPNMSWNTSGVCNDMVNTTQVACNAQPDRLWNAGTSTCAIIMKGDDRNNVTCALHGGTWATSGFCIGVWVMPARTAYTPALLTGNGPGDRCLRCHNSETQYNGPRVRDVENYLFHGHKNMARKVTVGTPWGGPPFNCSLPTYTNEEDCEDHGGDWNPTTYPSDDTGNAIHWTPGTITVGGVDRNMAWIYGDWLSPLPRVIYKAPASASSTCSDPRSGICSNAVYLTQVDCEAALATWTTNGTSAGCTGNGFSWIKNAGASYSCGRCHTTGWTSDSVLNAAKEPEKSFPGITWLRTADATADVVNMSGGVTGDSSKYSSWDVWGITCNRCHNAAIDPSNPVSGSSPTQYNAPGGMSTHNNGMTGFDAGTSGYCTDARWTAQAQCSTAGGAWLTACSKPGACSNVLYTTSGTCVAGGGTWTVYADQTTCQNNGGTWPTASNGNGSCSLAGVCNDLDPTHNTSALCVAAGAQWAAITDVVRCLDVHEFGKEHGIPAYEAAVYTGTKSNRGQVITRLCMDCHRQESGGMPYANTVASAGTYDTVNPGRYLKVGPAHSTFSFVSHPHANEFLNSPHGKFSGTFNEVATGKFNFAGTGAYKSFFQQDGEAAGTGNGCTGCHSIHNSVVEATGPEPAIKEECTECHAKDLNLVMHPKKTGTPLENMATDPVEACEICHMPDKMHLFRVKADGAYTTFPVAAITATSLAQCTAAGGTWVGTGSSAGCTVNANKAADGTWTDASWVDMDHSCGQCHGGGTQQATTTGSIASGSKTLTVTSTTGFVAGERVTIADGGSLTYDDLGAVVNGDFETYIVSVTPPSTLNLIGAAAATVSGKAVVQNETKNGASWMSRTVLAGWAKGMHNDKPTASFGYSLGSPNTLTVNVDASASTCSGSAANCDAYAWSWGDGTPDGSGVTASHTYASPGATWTITLTVEQYSVGGASRSQSVTTQTPDFPPTASGTCSLDANLWIMTVTDTSTDPGGGIAQVTVNWGDGTMLSNDTAAPFGPFLHTFLNPGTFTVTHKAIDTIGQQSITTCAASPAYFTIGGTVKTPLGSNLAGATVIAKKGTQNVGSAFTNSLGQFTVNNLKPGTYSINVSRAGYTFPAPVSVQVGPNGSTGTITALTGAGMAPTSPAPEGKKQHGGHKGSSTGGVVTPQAR